MESKIKQNKHVGIYGICLQGNKVLCIKKGRGPYKGLFDLPGGGIEFGEDIKSALEREIKEEIGVGIKNAEIFKNADHSSFWDDDGVPTHTHHIGLYYNVSLAPGTIKTYPDGHDSEGAVWVDTSYISKENTSPIAYKVLKELFSQ
jgi:ADP-ribose pyrophosphatase YjhB (NUDIX family)